MNDASMKPCPFCGGNADPEGWLALGGRRGPECEGCGATAQSVEDWNRRAPEPDPKLDRDALMDCYQFGTVP
jgi:hypothetical protein